MTYIERNKLGQSAARINSKQEMWTGQFFFCGAYYILFSQRRPESTKFASGSKPQMLYFRPVVAALFSGSESGTFGQNMVKNNLN